MTAPIVLCRDLELWGYRVVGTIAFATRREWEPALLKLAVQCGALTPDLVVRELLGGRTGVARRLLDVCTGLGLLERRTDAWVATPAGRAAAESGSVLLPERGTWTAWLCDDPLLATPLFAVSPWKPRTAYEERGRTRAFYEALPPILTSMVGRLCTPPAGAHRALRIDELGREQKGERVDSRARLRATLTVAPSSVRVRVQGELEGERVDVELEPPSLPYDDVRAMLLEQVGLLERWDPGRGALRLQFGEAEDAERASLTRAVPLERPQIAGLGAFERTTLDKLTLLPIAVPDAAQWAEWRTLQALSTYAYGDTLERAYREATKDLGDLVPPCPSPAALAARVRGNGRPPPIYWRLQAPTDWPLDGRNAR